MNLQFHQASKLNRRLKAYVEATGRGEFPDIELSTDLIEVAKARAKVELEHARASVKFWNRVLFYADRDLHGGNGHA